MAVLILSYPWMICMMLLTSKLNINNGCSNIKFSILSIFFSKSPILFYLGECHVLYFLEIFAVSPPSYFINMKTRIPYVGAEFQMQSNQRHIKRHNDTSISLSKFQNLKGLAYACLVPTIQCSWWREKVITQGVPPKTYG